MRALAAVREARKYVRTYGVGAPIRSLDIDRLLRAGSIEVLRADMRDIPVDVWPRMADGVIRMFIDESVGPQLARYAKLHEVGHWLSGDAEEATAFRFKGPLPEAEPVADLFALVGLLDDADTQAGSEWVESKIRELVPLDDRGWQAYRIPWLAPEVVTMREVVREWED